MAIPTDEHGPGTRRGVLVEYLGTRHGALLLFSGGARGRRWRLPGYSWCGWSRCSVPAGPVMIGLDDTIERRWGAKARGIYRDPVRSIHGPFRQGERTALAVGDVAGAGTAEEDVLAYMSFPPRHATKLHSTDQLERLNG